METILPKNKMSEEDIKLNFITPALLDRGWKNKITMETKVCFADGKCIHIAIHGIVANGCIGLVVSLAVRSADLH